jgi:hypothetical protein
MRYRVLDDIAFYAPPAGESGLVGKSNVRSILTATVGDVVELADKDASALLSRGAILRLPDGEG